MPGGIIDGGVQLRAFGYKLQGGGKTTDFALSAAGGIFVLEVRLSLAGFSTRRRQASP